MNVAVALGLDAVKRLGAQTAIVLPGDIPLITTDDLEALIAAAENAERAVVVGASRDGLGTNALLLRPIDVIAPAFGATLRRPPPSRRPARWRRHTRAAQPGPRPGRRHPRRPGGAVLTMSVGPHTARLLAHPALI